MKNILLTWIDDRDVEAVREDTPAPTPVPPLRYLLDSKYNDILEEIHVVSHHPAPVNKRILGLSNKIRIHPVEAYVDRGRRGEGKDEERERRGEWHWAHLLKILNDIAGKDVNLYLFLHSGPSVCDSFFMQISSQCPATTLIFLNGEVIEWNVKIPWPNENTARRIFAAGTKLRLENISEFVDILGDSDLLQQAKQLAFKTSRCDVDVLLLGETGVGKELFARAIHRASSRGHEDTALKKFVAINCAAIPNELFESELFGHVKGSFTGATKDRQGSFELANGGTLFLDEIGDLNLQNQAKLLRVLQSEGPKGCVRKVRPVGKKDDINCDVRVITATNRDLRVAMSKGQFREDLYWRLAGAYIRIPPLRERGGDVVLIAKKILDALNVGIYLFKPKKLTVQALKKMQDHHWPGNVRELKQVVDRAFAFTEVTKIEPDDLLFLDSSAPPLEDPIFSRVREKGFILEDRMLEIEKAFVDDALKESVGNVSKAAKRLGMKQQTLDNKIKKWKNRATHEEA